MTTDTRCSRCGAPATPGARFCMKCGADLSGIQAQIATAAVGADARPAAPFGPAPDLIDRLRAATLGDYEILAELGRGGMATVFLAHDIQLDRKVAIKLMHPQAVHGEGMVERFKLEARTAAGLSHPHIIPIYAVKQSGDLVYFVMKFVDGRPLDSILRGGTTLPVPMVRTVLTRVGEALDYAHRSGVVHRDIKPANIMIDSEGMPVVTDFGIAKVADAKALTMTGATIGTPTYMSPEQCNAEPITGASDQYSLGVTAYEMLTGRPLYEGESVVTIMFKQVHGRVPPPEDFGSSVPRDLADAVIRMLQKDPADRWPSMADALPALRGRPGHEEDAVRTQMIEFARAGTHQEILARVSTPRSPIPAATHRSRAAAPPTRTLAERPPRRSRAVVMGSVAALALVAGSLAVLRPWAARTAEEPPGNPAARLDSSAVAEDPLPAVPESTPPVAQTPPAQVRQPEPAPGEPAAVPHEVRIVDPPASLAEGATASLHAAVVDQRGRVMDRAVRWTSSAPEVVEIRPDGQVRAVAPGRATVTAAVDGLRTRVELAVTAVVASVTVTPASEELHPGGALDLTATTRARNGTVLPGRAVTWGSSDETVAVVSPTGHVSAVGTGTAHITATSEGQTGTSQIAVTAPVPTPPQPAARPPEAVEDAHAAITELIAAYARALQAKDVARAKTLYPEMTPAKERQTRDALDAMDDLRVRFTPSNITVSGRTAQVLVTAEWVYRHGRQDATDLYQLEHRSTGWVIVSVTQAK